MLSLVLYLCVESPDLEDASGNNAAPGIPPPVKTKQGPRRFPAQQTTVWKAGYRTGEFLRRSKQSSRESQGGTHAAPTPHVRRAHWHIYWAGPRKDPSKRYRVLRWIPPTPVGFRWEDGVPIPTVKRVRGEG